MIRKTAAKLMTMILVPAMMCLLVGGQAAIASSAPGETGTAAEMPQNGIPLVIIHIDESEKAIAAAEGICPGG